jgi:hypothetical protein
MAGDIATAHLALDSDGLVWVRVRTGWMKAGNIAAYPDWDFAWGKKPHWYNRELDELYDAWQDAGEFARGCEEAAKRAYDESRGTFT